ncbi:hypothetical protein T484DRAFT_1810490 [Baffinella frigidus]|nr:hypothetical protein T484DRAFT_1810490 [Cryptophyta sp. CCMP2293]
MVDGASASSVGGEEKPEMSYRCSGCCGVVLRVWCLVEKVEKPETSYRCSGCCGCKFG